VTQLSPEQRQAAAALIRRKEIRDSLRAGLFDRQQMVLDGKKRYKAILCGRRSGKTELLARKIILALLDCGQEDFVGYAATTKSLAKDLMWGKLKREMEKYGLTAEAGWRVLENESMIHTPRGGFFKLFGFDAVPELEKVRGYRCRFFCMDEIATVAKSAEYIVEQAVGPALMDLGGELWVAGTPGMALDGWWWKASTGQLERFEIFSWCMLQNSKWPKTQANPGGLEGARMAYDEELRENGWDDETPKAKRELRGIWCAEPNRLVFGDYVPERNKKPPAPWDSSWRFTLGIDFGTTDPNAWVVLATAPDSPVTYVVETKKQGGLPPEKVSEITKELVIRYRPEYVIGDAAGKAFIDDFNDRWGHLTGTWITPAYKPDKVGQIDVVNSQFRQGHLCVAGDQPELEAELATFLWEDENRTRTPKRANDHLCDALRYAVYTTRASHQHETFEPPPDPLAGFEARAARELRRRSEVEEQWGIYGYDGS
jgi:hypothetical protein